MVSGGDNAAIIAQTGENEMNKIDWSKAPEGATHAAPAGHGVCWYRIYDGGYHYWYSDLGATWGRWEKGTGGPFHGPMEARPESKADQEKIGWFPGSSLPPVGVVCEVYDGGDTWPQYEIVVYDGDVPIYHFRKGANGVGAEEVFRPLKSHRDKVIEAAYLELGGDLADFGTECQDNDALAAIEALYNAHMLKLPEGEE